MQERYDKRVLNLGYSAQLTFRWRPPYQLFFNALAQICSQQQPECFFITAKICATLILQHLVSVDASAPAIESFRASWIKYH